jgi:phage gp29-like protein
MARFANVIPMRLRAAAYRVAARAQNALSPLTGYGGGYGGQLYAVPNLTPSGSRELGKPLYVPNIMDRTVYLDQSEVTPELVANAKLSARQGNLVMIARLNDTMVCGDPCVKGSRLQRKVGVSSVKWTVKDADDSPEAQEIGDAVREACQAPDASMDFLIHGLVEHVLRGAGLTEVIWSSAADTSSKFRRWTAFQHVPQARLRWNLDGRFAMAETVGQFQGIPIDELPRGKFIPFTIDEEIPNYGLRGYYPAIWSPYLDRLYGRKWRRTYTERFGSPIPSAEFETETQADGLRKALLDFGVPGFVVPRGTNFKLEGGPTGGKDDPQRQIMLDAADEINICLVGQAQTANIREGAGSKASASVQNLVRGDILMADWSLIGFLISQNLFGSFVEQNFGPDNLPLTPRLIPDFEEKGDLFMLSQALKILVGLGLKVPAAMLYQKGIQEPSGDEDEELLNEPAPPPAPFGGLPFGGGPPGAAGQEGPGKKPGGPEKPASSQDGGDPTGEDPEPVTTAQNAARMMRMARRIAQRQDVLEGDLVDIIAGKYLVEGANAARPLLGDLKAIVEDVVAKGGSLKDVKDRVLGAYGKLPIAQLTDLLASATLEAEMRGLLESADERRPA